MFSNDPQANEVLDLPWCSGRARKAVPARELGTDQARWADTPARSQVSDDRSPEIPIIIAEDDTLILDKYLGTGLQEGESELPEASTCPSCILWKLF